jgi:hypothetical protein
MDTSGVQAIVVTKTPILFRLEFDKKEHLQADSNKKILILI